MCARVCVSVCARMLAGAVTVHTVFILQPPLVLQPLLNSTRPIIHSIIHPLIIAGATGRTHGRTWPHTWLYTRPHLEVFFNGTAVLAFRGIFEKIYAFDLTSFLNY